MPFKPGRHVSEWLARSLCSWLTTDTSDEGVNPHLQELPVGGVTAGLTQDQAIRVVSHLLLVWSLCCKFYFSVRRAATSLVADCRALGCPSRFLVEPIDIKPDTALHTNDSPQ